MVSLNFFNVFL